MHETATATRPVPAAPAAPRRPRRDEYRGNPLIVLPMGESREFSFGVGKARAILEWLADIRAFVAEHEAPAVPRA